MTGARQAPARRVPPVAALLALVTLAVFVELNLSEALVRSYGWPSLLQMLVVPVALVALASRPWRETAAVLTQGLVLWLAAWVLLQWVTTGWAHDTELADERVVETAKAFVLFLLVALLARTGRRLVAGVWAFLAGGCLLAALGVYQVATGDFDHRFAGLARVKDAQIYGDVFEPRIAGPLGDPNFFAQILLALVPLALALAWHGRSRRERLLAAGAAGLLVTGTVFTYSRGGALALAAVLVLAWLGRGVKPREVAAGVAVLAILWLALPASFTERLTTLEQITGGEEAALHPDSSFEKRRLVTVAAWRMFQAHPFLGVGAGNYPARFAPFGDQVGSGAREYDDPFAPAYPHSLYLEIAAETGLLGLLVLGAALAVTFASLHTARRRLAAAGLGLEATLAGAVAIGLVGYLVSSLFLHGDFQRYLWMLFALAAACHDLGRRAVVGEGGTEDEEAGAPREAVA